MDSTSQLLIRSIALTCGPPAMSLQLVPLDSSRADDWEMLNERSVEGTLFHSLRWKRLLEESFSFDTRYAMIYRDNKAAILCPFFATEISGLRGLVALPDDTLNPSDHLVADTDEFALGEAIRTAQRVAKMDGMSYLILGVSENQRGVLSQHGLSLRTISGRMVLDLTEISPDWIWSETFSNNQRNKIRRFDREGFTLDYVTSREDIEAFHSHYARNLQRFGAKPYPLSFFERLANTYSGNSADQVVLTLLRKGEFIAGGILALFWNARKILYWRYYALNRPLPNRYTPFYYLLWHAVIDAYERGCTTVDFGGTDPNPEDVHFRMKKEFGCSYVPRYRLILPISNMAKLLLSLKKATSGRFISSTPRVSVKRE